MTYTDAQIKARVAATERAKSELDAELAVQVSAAGTTFERHPDGGITLADDSAGVKRDSGMWMAWCWMSEPSDRNTGTARVYSHGAAGMAAELCGMLAARNTPAW